MFSLPCLVYLKDDDEDSESMRSFAATEVYQSPATTPRRLSMVDMLVAKETDFQAIKENKDCE